MDLLALIIAAVLGLGSAGVVPTDAGSGNTDSCATASSELPPEDTTEARSHIIDLGNQ